MKGKLDPSHHPEVNKPCFYEYIKFKGNFYYGTVKDGIAILYDNPFDSSIPKMRVKVKKSNIETIKDDGDNEVLIIEGEIIK